MEISHFSFLISHLFSVPLHSILEIVCKGALSSAGLEHLPYKQRVGGSNPSAPTQERVPRGTFLLERKYSYIYNKV